MERSEHKSIAEFIPKFFRDEVLVGELRFEVLVEKLRLIKKHSARKLCAH